MRQYAVLALMFFLLTVLWISDLSAADHWPPNTVLKYIYSSTGEPSGAGGAFGLAVVSWDAAATCYSFTAGSGMGIVEWITNKNDWDAVRGDVSQTGLALAISDHSTHFTVYFNSAYRTTSEWSTLCDAGKADVMSIALHELGHVLGLGDCINCTGTVMKKPYNISTPDCWSGPYDTDKNAVNSFCGSPPAASVEAFLPFLAAGGAEIFVDLSQMRGSKAFWVNRQDGSLVGDTVRADDLAGHTFEIRDAFGVPTERYYLYERDHRGVFLRACEGVFESKPEVAKASIEFDPAELEQILLSRYGRAEASSGTVTGMIVCPDSFVSAAQILTGFWSSRGRSVAVAPLSLTGCSREEIKAYIENAYAAGVRYVLLAGCASDHEWFDDPSKWPDHPGEQDWYHWYVDYHSPDQGDAYLVSHPERDLIPTWYFPDTLYDNMSYWMPYYSGDWYYAEGLPELRVGRFPAANRAQLLAMISKDIWHVENTPNDTWGHTTSLWGFCQSTDGNSGPLLKAICEDFWSRVPSHLVKYTLLDTMWTYPVRETQAVAEWNAGRGTIWMQGTSSTPYRANQFFSKSAGWNIGKLAVDKLPLVIGANCGIGAYDMAQSATYGEPVAQELLGSDPQRGAWAVIAPSRGTWIEGDRQMCDALNEYLYVEPVQDLGTAFMLALRDMRQGNERQCAESFNLLGDPMAPVPTMEVTEVEEQTPDYTRLRLYPNPFNPSVTIEYDVPQPCFVELTIYNILGQRVCRLVSELRNSGSYSAIWKGVDGEGRRVSSGVYFCRLLVGAHQELRKVILLQ